MFINVHTYVKGGGQMKKRRCEARSIMSEIRQFTGREGKSNNLGSNFLYNGLPVIYPVSFWMNDVLKKVLRSDVESIFVL